MTNLLDRPLVPVASTDDAIATYEQLRPYLLQTEFVPIVVHVIEKAGGSPDKASVEQRKEHAEKAFDAFRKRGESDGVSVEMKLLYGTDIAKAIHEAATEIDATAIIFSSRGGSRWLDLVSGNVRSKLIADHDCPVIVLPSDGDLRE
ncbi:universal stress protein [Natronosalvus amylolyticus]|uniref:universal stress protein n=1 Tax=Natronosalvus amylolyticus TaxID=2961994 RepID=UPI0020C9FB5F|nr:universal stress protein [Natronosalvus amylolyticus]